MSNGNHTSIIDAKFVNGTDYLSPVDDIGDGFVADLLNMSPNAAGELVGRPGTYTRNGLIPLRIDRLVYTEELTDNLTFFLAGSPDVFSTLPRRIMVRGRTSVAGNPDNVGCLPNNAITEYYFNTFKTQTVVQVTGNSGFTTLDVSAFAFVGAAERTSFVNRSSSNVVPNTATFEASNTSVTIDLQGSADGTYYVFSKEVPVTLGEIFHFNFTLSSSASEQLTTITSAQHGCGEHLLVKVFKVDGTVYEEIVPERVEVTTANAVRIGIIQNTGADIEYRAIICKSEANYGILLTNAVTSVVVPDYTTPFNFTSVYYREPDTDWTEVKPDAIAFDADTESLTITLDNSMGVASAELKIVSIASNTTTSAIIVSAPTLLAGEGFADNSPLLDLYGIDAGELQENFASPIILDAYRDQIDETPVVGANRSMYIESASGISNATVNLSATITGDAITIIGPVFTNLAYGRTSGEIVHTDVSSAGLVRNPTVIVAGPGEATIRLRLPAYTKVGEPITTAHELHLQNMAWPQLDGNWPILTVTYTSADLIDITVSLPAFESFMAGESGGHAGILTSTFATQTDAPFVVGDILRLPYGDESQSMVVASVNGTAVTVTSPQLILPFGQTLAGTRTSNLIPLSSSLVLRGDTTWIGGQPYNVLRARPSTNHAATNVSCDGVEAFLTVTGIIPDAFEVGEKLLILGAEELSGVREIANISVEAGATILSFAFTSVIHSTAISGMVAGNTIELRNPMTFSDGLVISLPSRWHALEAQSGEDNKYCMDFGLQSVSSGARQNLYIQNEYDWLTVLDDSGYRHCLPPWNPLLSIRTIPKEGIYVPDITVTTTGLVGTSFKVAKGEQTAFEPGNELAVYNGATFKGFVTVLSISESATDGYVNTVLISGEYGDDVAGSLVFAEGLYRYRARIRVKDRNGNELIGPACGDAFAEVRLTPTESLVQLTLMEPPYLKYIDTSGGVYIDIMRTTYRRLDEFYPLASLVCEFDDFVTFPGSDPQLSRPMRYYLDSAPDEAIKYGGTEQLTFNALNVIASGKPNQLAGLIRPPLRSKTMTSAANHLCFGNIVDDPTLTLEIYNPNTFNANTGLSFVIECADDTATLQLTTSKVACTFESFQYGTKIYSTNTHVVGEWIYVFGTELSSNPAVDINYWCHGWFQIEQVASDMGGAFFSFNAPTGDMSGYVHEGFYVKAPNPTHLPIYYGTDDLAWGDTRAVQGRESTAARVLRRVGQAINSYYAKRGLQDFITARFDISTSVKTQLWLRSVSACNVTINQVQPESFGRVFAVNGNIADYATAYSFAERVWPSRLIVSGRDNPEVIAGLMGSDTETLNLGIMDINPADGDEIMAIRPLLGQAVFGASQQEQVLVVFKRRSIYIVDLFARFSNAQNWVQQVSGKGIGCHSPRGVAYTDDGFLFTGLDKPYLLARDYQVQPVGEVLERKLNEWNYSSEVLADRVAVHTGENSQIWIGLNSAAGALVRKQEPDQQCWSTWSIGKRVFDSCRTLGEELISIQGRVLGFINTLLGDDGAAFEQSVEFRATDFAKPELKDLNEIFLNVGTGEWTADTNESFTVQYATDLHPVWLNAETATLRGQPSETNLNAETLPTRSYLRYAVPAKRFQQIQIRASLTTKERLRISKLAYLVRANQSARGTLEAAD